MALVVNTFNPDTCNCEVEFEFDDAIPGDLRIHTLKRIVAKGAEHAGILDATLYTTILEESRRKNIALAICEEKGVPLDSDGNVQVNWAFTPGRVLQVSFRVATPGARKRSIQDDCDLRLGPTKVEVL